MSNNIIICCKDCTIRKVGCHSKCKEYVQSRKEQDLYNKKERDNAKQYTDSKVKSIKTKINKNK